MADHRPPPRKEECIAAIRRHLQSGRTDTATIFELFPEINRATAYAWFRRERAGMPSQLEVTQAARAIQQRAKAGLTEHLPAVPAPATVAKKPEVLRQLDFAVEIPKLYSDAEMLRAFSIKEFDVDGQPVERIKNPVSFEKSIRARASLIETSLKVLQEVWDMRAMQQFNELIIEEIGRESPECQRRILQRMALLNQRHGVNFNGMRF